MKPDTSINPFANLDLSNLPPGPPEKGTEGSPQRLWKMGRVTLQRETAHRGGNPKNVNGAQFLSVDNLPSGDSDGFS